MSSAFEWVCGELAGAGSLSELETRGTVRLALRQSGLEARSVTVTEMAVVLRKVLPRELEQRGVADAAARCEALAGRIEKEAAGGPDSAAASSVEAVFRRLGGSTS